MLPDSTDYYFDENGLMVFTEAYHRKRGFCCGSGCRHCPYPTTVIREARPGDREAIHRVRQAAWRAAYRGILPGDVIEDAVSDQRLNQPWVHPDALIQASRASFAAMRTGRLLGFATGGKARSGQVRADVELWALYVHPDFQGQGVGRQLFERFREHCVGAGFGSLAVWVLKENTRARRFYEKLGGQNHPAEKMLRWNDRDIAPEVAYLWVLGVT